MVAAAPMSTLLLIASSASDASAKTPGKLQGRTIMFKSNSLHSVERFVRASPKVNGTKPDMHADLSGLGKTVQDGMIFCQNFNVRSYETGADGNASIETLMNYFQETALCHVKTVGLLGDGFGSTPEMYKRNLIWVVTKMQVIVDRYPTWDDVVQVDTWVAASGKNGMRRDWVVRDSNTGVTLTRASSQWVMLHKETRKLAKMPDEVREEIGGYFVDSPPVVDEDSRKLSELTDDNADNVRTGLTPRWSDLDLNQHVNNVKYVGWILEQHQSQITVCWTVLCCHVFTVIGYYRIVLSPSLLRFSF
ncbi:palmitoyl-acyl carrier protein thioesterase, chloroplastic-like isoform X2 [Olea europaea var. sylvestris]|uniref:palmitoyl-acyl carrier protein thioesterase, chloroplastic-like isoform X2 n=1 Tax=Olea europaea var. sylvestris TaxID=158386 RepID=UPI000C1CD2A6|nr:palmitoyl-acyl carrier protein thioesterase, chloroplastic-like isoform X2 [Olea europaea var. sylvestris]